MQKIVVLLSDDPDLITKNSGWPWPNYKTVGNLDLITETVDDLDLITKTVDNLDLITKTVDDLDLITKTVDELNQLHKQWMTLT